jgi:GTPase
VPDFDEDDGDFVEQLEAGTENASHTRALVIGPYITKKRGESLVHERSVIARLEEALGLAAAIDLDHIAPIAVSLSVVRPSTYIGKGKVEEIKAQVTAKNIALVVMDCALSPVQQRNLERAWGTKVIDRTGLILEIFGRRARTREGRLQVELAHLAYQKSRLVRSWTHLERQRGGFGFLGGPGETQIEADRRQIQERMTRIEHDLEKVIKTRTLHRKSRRRVPYPIVALVGYTNAGKSSLFNRLTAANVMAEDMLFATLDPTARLVVLPHGEKVILSDTVGFISDLPTMLVAAFRATLEDVIEADLILHVRDIANLETDAQAHDVKAVLHDLGLKDDAKKPMIEVWNKADLLDEETHQRLIGLSANVHQQDAPRALVSALTGEGVPQLLQQIERSVGKDRPVFRLTLELDQGHHLNWLYEQAEILERRHDEEGRSLIVARLSLDKEPRFMQRFPSARRLR